MNKKFLLALSFFVLMGGVNTSANEMGFQIVEAGGQLIIDGGTLSNVDIVLKVGASLQIINGGIIETRNGFEAPLGAIVEIVHGQIL